MLKINNTSGVLGDWHYFSQRLGVGFVAHNRDGLIQQVQTAYISSRIDFAEQEIPALIEDYMCAQRLAKDCSERIEGLGDLVHVALLPFVKVVDSALGTKIQGCSGCAVRRKKLNEVVPFK